MSDRIDLLIVPSVSTEILARALAEVDAGVSDLLAVVMPVEEGQAVVVRLLDAHGQPSTVDLAPFARALSARGHRAGVAHIDPVGGHRGWQGFHNGTQELSFTPADEPYVPHDEDGLPDMDVAPRRLADGVPPGWRRLRSCLDLGMQRLVSCRFTPVARAVERLHAAEPGSARAFALVVGGRTLRPPQELPLQDLFRR